MSDASRHGLVAAAIRVSAFTIAWALVTGVTSVVSGVVAHSLSLVGFGLAAVIDGSASSVLVWRFRVERRDADRAHRVEHIAHRAIAAGLLLAATYITAQAIRSLVTHEIPARSGLGIVIAAVSLFVLPVLAVIKLRLAARLHSRALRGDGLLTAAGGVLALAVLASLLLEETLGWWWSDAVAALFIAAFLTREAVSAWRS